MVKKKNKYIAKKKKRLIKLCVLIRSPLSPYHKLISLLMPYFMPAFVPALMLILVPASIFCLASLTVLLSHYVPTLISHLRSLVVLSSCCISALATSAIFFLPCHAPVFCCGILVLLSPLPNLLGPPLFPGSSLFRIFKRFLLDKS